MCLGISCYVYINRPGLCSMTILHISVTWLMRFCTEGSDILIRPHIRRCPSYHSSRMP